jgi:hypothetical protein
MPWSFIWSHPIFFKYCLYLIAYTQDNFKILFHKFYILTKQYKKYKKIEHNIILS